MKQGDLVLFAWPDSGSRVDDPLDWERARIGLVVSVSCVRPDDVKYDNELLVLHEGERWSVPEAWCRPIKE
jgi:hypothetical protein